jgi:hypothetical protein
LWEVAEGNKEYYIFSISDHQVLPGVSFKNLKRREQVFIFITHANMSLLLKCTLSQKFMFPSEGVMNSMS